MISDLESIGPYITWTKPKVRKLRKELNMVIKSTPGNWQEAVFTFEGHEFLAGYVVYLLESLEEKFGIKDKKKH